MVSCVGRGVPGLYVAWQIEDSPVEPIGYPSALVFKTDERPSHQTSSSEIVHVFDALRVWPQAGDERSRSLQQTEIGDFFTQSFDNRSIAGLTGEAVTE